MDQRVVEHTMFLQQMDQFGEMKNFKSSLNEVHHQLLESGDIREEAPKANVAQLWKKYKRVMAVAASIAGITTLLIAGMATYYSRKKIGARPGTIKKRIQAGNAKKTNEVYN